MFSILFFITLIISDVILLEICRIVWKEWSHPVFLINVLYMVLILVAYCGLKKYPWSFEGVTWLTMALYFLTAGGAFGKQIFKKRKPILCDTNSVRIAISNKAWIFLTAMIVLSIAGWLYQVVYNGFSLSSFTSMDSLAQMNNSIAVEHYAGQSKTNILIKISTIFYYVGPVCGGFLFPFSETKTQKKLSILSMLPIVLLMLFSSGKSGFLSCIVLWGSAFLTSYFYVHKQAPKINFSKLFGYAVLAVLAFVLLLFSMMLRIGHVDSETFDIVTEKFISYAFGEIQAFDWWFKVGRSNLNYSAGVQTFMAIFHNLGMVERKSGVYDFIPGTVSNVYTVFRGIIEDFGTVGGLVFVAICGCIAGYYFEKIKYSVKLPVVSCSFVVGIDFLFIYGYIISPWIYTSYVIMMFFFIGFVALCKGKNIIITYGNKILIG